MPTICFFGYPNQTYSRSKILIDGLKKNQAKVVLCTDKSGFAVKRYYQLFKKFLSIHQKVDVIFVQFPGNLNMPIAWAIGKIFNKPVIFDAFISMYDTYIFDRQIATPDSFKAKFYWWVDKISCTLAGKVTLDTNAHIRYFVKTFHLPRSKFYRLPVGGDDTVFKPKTENRKPKTDKLIVEFHGMFTRLHGAEVFVKAAKQLENKKNLEFWLIGDSHNYRLPINLYKKLKPKTMKYFPRLTVKNLAQKVRSADISVGHLGPTQKARMVVTNKMFHALASKVALIAGRNQASRELFKDKHNCLFTTMYNVNDLAKKITYLANRPKLRRSLAENGFNLHQQKLTNQLLGKRLLEIISS